MANPSLEEFIAAARPLNPDATDEEIVSYWRQNYAPKVEAPSLDAFVSAAKPLNPGVSDDEIKSYWEANYKSAYEAANNRTWGQFAGDMAVKAGQGAIGLGESAVGLADIATGGAVGAGLEKIGYDPDRAKEMLGNLSSEKQKRLEQTVSAAGQGEGVIDGFVNQLSAIAQNPSFIPGAVVESLPSMLAAGGGARALAERIYSRAIAAGATEAAAAEAVAKSAGALKWAAAAGEGAISAGQIAEDARQAGRDWAQYVLPALTGGTLTAGIGRAAGAIPGLGDVETALFTRGVGAATGNRAVRTVKGAFQEGLLEEMPQSGQEQLFGNIAQGKPAGEDVGSAAAQGLVTGVAMGGGAGLISSARPAAAPTPITGTGQPVSDSPIASTTTIERDGQRSVRTSHQDGSVDVDGVQVQPPRTDPVAETLAQAAPVLEASGPDLASATDATIQATVDTLSQDTTIADAADRARANIDEAAARASAEIQQGLIASAQNVPDIGTQDDRSNETRIPSQVREGQEPIQAQPEQRASAETAETGGILQAQGPDRLSNEEIAPTTVAEQPVSPPAEAITPKIVGGIPVSALSDGQSQAIPATPQEAAAATTEHLEAARNLTRSPAKQAVIDQELQARNPEARSGIPLAESQTPDTAQALETGEGRVTPATGTALPETRIPTVDIMRQAIDRIGAKQFEQAVADHLSDLGELSTEERAAEIEGVARLVVDGAYDAPGIANPDKSQVSAEPIAPTQEPAALPSQESAVQKPAPFTKREQQEKLNVTSKQGPEVERYHGYSDKSTGMSERNARAMLPNFVKKNPNLDWAVEPSTFPDKWDIVGRKRVTQQSAEAQGNPDINRQTTVANPDIWTGKPAEAPTTAQPAAPAESTGKGEIAVPALSSQAPAAVKEPWEMDREDYIAARMDTVRNDKNDPNYGAMSNYASRKGGYADLRKFEKGLETTFNNEWYDANEKAAIEGKPVLRKPNWMMTRAEFERVTGNDAEEHEMSVKAALTDGKPVPATTLAEYPALAGAKPIPKSDKFFDGMTPQDAGKARAALNKTFTFREEGREIRGSLQDSIAAKFVEGWRVVLTASGPAFVDKDMAGWSKREIGNYGMQYANWLSSQESASNPKQPAPAKEAAKASEKTEHAPFTDEERRLIAESVGYEGHTEAQIIEAYRAAQKKEKEAGPYGAHPAIDLLRETAKNNAKTLLAKPTGQPVGGYYATDSEGNTIGQSKDRRGIRRFKTAKEADIWARKNQPKPPMLAGRPITIASDRVLKAAENGRQAEAVKAERERRAAEAAASAEKANTQQAEREAHEKALYDEVMRSTEVRNRYFEAVSAVALPKGVKKTIAVDSARGNAKLELTGTDYDGLLLHKENADKNEPYAVSDVKSGIRITRFPRVDQAKDFIRAVIHANLPRADLAAMSKADTKEKKAELARWSEIVKAHTMGGEAPKYFTEQKAEPTPPAPEPNPITTAAEAIIAAGEALKASVAKPGAPNRSEATTPETKTPADLGQNVDTSAEVPTETRETDKGTALFDRYSASAESISDRGIGNSQSLGGSSSTKPLGEHGLGGINIPSETSEGTLVRNRGAVSTGQANRMELLTDKGHAALEFLANSSIANTAVEQGFKSLSIENQRKVESRVFSAIHDGEIFRTVVSAVPIDVMNNLVKTKFSANAILNYPAVFLKALAANSASSISNKARIVDTLLPAIRNAAHELAPTGFGANNSSGIVPRSDLANNGLGANAAGIIGGTHGVISSKDSVVPGRGGAETSSLPPSIPQGGITAVTLRAEIARAFGSKAANLVGNLLIPIQKQSEISNASELVDVASLVREGDKIAGFYHPSTGTSYAVLENLQPQDVRGLVLHEIGIHAGFQGMLGDAKYAQVVRQLDAMRRAGNKAVIEAHRQATEQAAKPDQVPEETIAYLVTNRPELPFVQRLIAQIKAFLFRKFGIGKLTVDDIAALARASVFHASEGVRNGEPQFSRSQDQTQTGVVDLKVPVHEGDVFQYAPGQVVTALRQLPGGRMEVRIQGKRTLTGDMTNAELKALPRLGRADYQDGAYTTPSALTNPDIRFSRNVQGGLLNNVADGFESDPSPEEANKVQAGIEGKSAREAALFIAKTAPNRDYRLIAYRVARQLRRMEDAGLQITIKVAHLGDEAYTELAGKMKGVTWRSWDSKTIDIWVQGADVTGLVGTSYETVLHELLHAVTQSAIYIGKEPGNTAMHKDVEDLYRVNIAIVQHIQGQIAKAGGDVNKLDSFIEKVFAQGHNSLREPGEVLSWALTNRRMQDYLEGVPYKGGTLWSRFVSAIRKVLGLPSHSETALSEILRITDSLLDSPVQQLLTITAPTQINYNGGLMNTATAVQGGAVGAPDWVKKQPADMQETLRKAGAWKPKETLQERFAGWTANWQQKLKQGMVDQFDPIKSLNYRAYMLARMTKSAAGPLESALFDGTVFIDKDGAVDVNYEKGGFIGKMQALKGEHDRFFAWVVGNRAARLMEEGREHNFSKEDIARLKTLNRGKMEGGGTREIVYVKALADLNRYNKSILDMAEKAGLIDAEARPFWEKDFYIPFYRMTEGDETKGPVKSGGLVRQYAFKTLKGGEQAIGDPMENILKNWAHLIDASLKNQAAVASLDAAVKVGVAHETTADEKGAVFVMKDGKKTYYGVDDPFVLDAINSLGFSGFSGPAMKVMSSFKRWLTYGVTISPTFRVRNIIRDSISMIGTNPASYNVLDNVLTGWKLTEEDSPSYASMIAGGGVIRFGTLERDGAANIKRLIDAGVEAGTILNSQAKVKAMLKDAYDWWMRVGDRSENVNRAALYQKLRDEGKSHLEASYAARDTMDFSMMGTWSAVRFLAQTVPFFNARLQGMYKLGRGAAEDPRRFAYVVGATALASIALLLAYKDDDDWKQREDFDRESFWWFKIGDKAFRIPKPFEIGAIGTLAERGLEAMITDDLTGKQFIQRMGSVVGQQLSMNPVPQLFMPMIETWANKDSFTGRAIETLGMEKLSPSERIGANTSAFAQLAGKNGIVSPVQIDHLINGYFGWLGTHAVATADLALRPGMSLPEKPAMRIDDVFVLGDFARDLPAYQSRYVTRLYEQGREVQQIMADMRAYQKIGATEKAAEILQDNGDKIRLYRLYTHAEQQLTKINQQIKITQKRTGDADVKRARLDQLYAQRNRIAKLTEDRARATQQ